MPFTGTEQPGKDPVDAAAAAAAAAEMHPHLDLHKTVLYGIHPCSGGLQSTTRPQDLFFFFFLFSQNASQLEILS